ncbi:MAG: DUF6326 family protein [Anaerolineales bacterium]|jgi:hypothetical protein
MEEIRIKLSGLWTALILTYLLGDVLRIFSGDFVPGEMGEMGGMQITQGMYLGLAILLLIPIIMVFLSLVLKYRANRWTNLVLAAFFFIFNLFGLPTYPSLYDQFLIIVGLVFNGLTFWYAWKWPEPES